MTERKVLVCDQCLRASCWYGEFMCDNARGAGTGILTTRQLRRLAREHPDYWSRKKFKEIYGDPVGVFSPREPDLTDLYGNYIFDSPRQNPYIPGRK